MANLQNHSKYYLKPLFIGMVCYVTMETWLRTSDLGLIFQSWKAHALFLFYFIYFWDRVSLPVLELSVDQDSLELRGLFVAFLIVFAKE